MLAESLRLKLADLAPRMGISERMLFGYRSGTYPISSKAWRKLESAERAAGIVEFPDQTGGRAPGESSAPLARSALPPYHGVRAVGQPVAGGEPAPGPPPLREETASDALAGLPPEFARMARWIVADLESRLSARLDALERRLPPLQPPPHK